MTSTSAGLPLKIIAVLLLVLVAWRAYNLVELQRSEQRLSSFASVDAETTSYAEQFKSIDEIAAGRLSAAQSERLETLRHKLPRNALLATASFVWPDGSKLILGEALTAQIGTPKSGAPRLMIDAKALGRPLALVKIDGKTVDAKAGSWDLPLALDTESPSQRLSLQLALDSNASHEFQVNFLRDRNPPQLAFTGKDGRAIEQDGGILGLLADETLELELQDGTLMREVRMSLDGEVIQEITNQRVVQAAVFTLPAGETDRKAKLLVEAWDWSDNALSETFELRLEEPAAARLVSATLAGESLLSGPLRSKEAKGEIEVTIEGRPQSGRIKVEIEGAEPVIIETKAAKTTSRLPFAFTEARDDLVARFWLTRYDVRVEIGAIKIIHDGMRPRIDLFDEQGAPVLVDKISLQGGGKYRLEVSDNDLIDFSRELADREGGVRLDAPHKETKLYSQAVRVVDTGRLLVVARDLAGNESRRDFDFTVTAMLAPDDGEGPEIELYAGATRLDPAVDQFFWQESGYLELRLDDQAGVDLASLQVERLEIPGGGLQGDLGAMTGLRIPVRAKGDPVVEVADRHGRKTRSSWPIVIVSGPAEIHLSEDAARVEKLPVTFQWRLKDIVPQDALRCSIVAADGSERLLASVDGKGQITSADIGANGPCRLVLRLLTPLGAVDIASSSFSLALADEAASGAR